MLRIAILAGLMAGPAMADCQGGATDLFTVEGYTPSMMGSRPWVDVVVKNVSDREIAAVEGLVMWHDPLGRMVGGIALPGYPKVAPGETVEITGTYSASPDLSELPADAFASTVCVSSVLYADGETQSFPAS